MNNTNTNVVVFELYHLTENDTYEYRLGNCHMTAPIQYSDTTLDAIHKAAAPVIRQIGLIAKFAHVSQPHIGGSIVICTGMLAAMFNRLGIKSISGKEYNPGSKHNGLKNTIRATIRYYESHIAKTTVEVEKVVAINLIKYIKRYFNV